MASRCLDVIYNEYNRQLFSRDRGVKKAAVLVPLLNNATQRK